MIKKLWPYTAGTANGSSLGVLCSASEAVFELLLPLVMADIVGTGIPAGDVNYILTRGLLMVAMALLSMGLGIGAAFLSSRAARALAPTCAGPSTTISRSSPSATSRSSPPPPWSPA